jgi:hypothetical protein
MAPVGALYIAALLGLSLLAFVTVRLLRYRPRRGSPGNEEAINFNPARYQPMHRLLDAEDLSFLELQPGYRRPMGRRFRRNRRRIFRMYLDALSSDFHRIHRAARLMLAGSTADGGRVVGTLTRQRIIFWRELALLELKLLLPGPARIDAAGLVQAIEGIRADLSRVAATRAAA